MRRPYKEVIDVFQGDLHRAGMKPLTFVRQVNLDLYTLCKLITFPLSKDCPCCAFSQVLAACVYPPLINSSNLPLDVRQRAQEELGRCVGRSVGEGNICGLMTWKKMKMLVVQDPQGGAHKLHLPQV